MGKIIEAADIPEGDKVYLKKGMFGYRVVEPWKYPDGRKNYFNLLFGGKKNVIILIILILGYTMVYFGIQELISNYKIIADDPCSFCTSCHEQTRRVIDNLNNKPIDFSNISLKAATE